MTKIEIATKCRDLRIAIRDNLFEGPDQTPESRRAYGLAIQQFGNIYVELTKVSFLHERIIKGTVK